jgi:hypothetical protein
MSEALERIRRLAQDFTELVERCRICNTIAVPIKTADLQDAYSRLNRLRERYIREKKYLTASEHQALSKVFEHDTFIEGLITIRVVGDHVEQRTNPVVIYTRANVPLEFCVETSAMAVFAGPIVRLPDIHGQSQTINHLENLLEADKRVQKALARATQTREDGER